MSPSRACLRHGRVSCHRCAGEQATARRARHRPYTGTAAERAMRVAVLETYGSACHYCSKPIDLEHTGTDDSLELAHLQPHRDGGAFVLENLRPAHRYCNRAAGATTPGDPHA